MIFSVFSSVGSYYIVAEYIMILHTAQLHTVMRLLYSMEYIVEVNVRPAQRNSLGQFCALVMWAAERTGLLLTFQNPIDYRGSSLGYCINQFIFIRNIDVEVINHSLLHWNRNVIILVTFSSLSALKVVILTTFSAANDEDFIKDDIKNDAISVPGYGFLLDLLIFERHNKKYTQVYIIHVH